MGILDGQSNVREFMNEWPSPNSRCTGNMRTRRKNGSMIENSIDENNVDEEGPGLCFPESSDHYPCSHNGSRKRYGMNIKRVLL